MKSKRREFEWVGDCAFMQGVDVDNNSFLELPLSSSPSGPGSIVTGTGSPLQDTLFHRVLLDVQVGTGYTGAGGIDLPLGTWLSLGLLLTEWDASGGLPVMFSPAGPDLNNDAEWLWRYAFPVQCDAAPDSFYPQRFPQVPLRFDIPIRAGRGSRVGEKRRLFTWVATLQQCTDVDITGRKIDLVLSYLLLYSAGK